MTGFPILFEDAKLVHIVFLLIIVCGIVYKVDEYMNRKYPKYLSTSFIKFMLLVTIISLAAIRPILGFLGAFIYAFLLYNQSIESSNITAFETGPNASTGGYEQTICNTDSLNILKSAINMEDIKPSVCSKSPNLFSYTPDPSYDKVDGAGSFKPMFDGSVYTSQ